MGESKADIIKAKAKGYIKTIKVLSKEVSKITEPAKAKKDAVQAEAMKEEPSFANVKGELVELEVIARKYGSLSIDIERYLFKLGTMLFILEDIGENFEVESEEDKNLVNSALEHATDKNVFMYGNLEEDCIVLNEEYLKDMNSELDMMRSNDEYLKARFEQAKSRLVQQK